MTDEKVKAVDYLTQSEIYLLVIVTKEVGGKQTVKVHTNDWNDGHELCKEAMAVIKEELK